MAEITADLLVSALDKVGASFAPGELAYLALTSKPELPIRDRLAWALHTELPHCVVAREWKAAGLPGRARTDLAVLDGPGRHPLALLEAKAAYTFDFAGEHRQAAAAYTQRVSDDLAKARLAAQGRPVAAYALMLLTHPMGTLVDLPGVIKYYADISRSVRSYTAEGLRALAGRTACTIFQELGPIRTGSLQGGVAFGTEVSVDYWLIGPVLQT
ncbi:hypothetical protein [Streptomyces botrytidirepellens]|uniref:hypothetical protein n=1 Tax=Streptomyces botrytidirepellens TaxID=2486417 RepID=UPI0011CDDE72|nr:hypothetical protein [Streptomyces botrytidirepellens]